jgi:hypothetical protein
MPYSRLRVRNFKHVRALKKDGGLIIAPHPFFPAPKCLNGKLRENLDLFDAIEHSHFYTRTFNFNQKAIEYARKMGIPLVGHIRLPPDLAARHHLHPDRRGREDDPGRVRGHPGGAGTRGDGPPGAARAYPREVGRGRQRGHAGDATAGLGSAGLGSNGKQPKKRLAPRAVCRQSVGFLLRRGSPIELTS